MENDKEASLGLPSTPPPVVVGVGAGLLTGSGSRSAGCTVSGCVSAAGDVTVGAAVGAGAGVGVGAAAGAGVVEGGSATEEAAAGTGAGAGSAAAACCFLFTNGDAERRNKIKAGSRGLSLQHWRCLQTNAIVQSPHASSGLNVFFFSRVFTRYLFSSLNVGLNNFI